MKLTLAEPKYLKDSISIISDLVNEARFKITSDAIELIAMDPANVAMVLFKLLSSSFVDYSVKEDTEIAINLSSFKQVLNRSKPTDMITLELEENKLKILFKGVTTRTFYLPIIDVEEKEQRVPDLKFGVTITSSTSMITEAIEDADIVAESVTFGAEKNKFILSAEGDLSKAKIEINEDEETKILVEGESQIKSKYSIEYLKKMVKGSKIAPETTIRFSKDYPLKLEFNTLNKVSLAFILAPRVEND
ncbi:proliferating cell nuclear antigen (pcna) [Candidatus Woesearchaeota archaeon]|nr:MAG: proliferating cell nuclear antigen (pcna) [Candidatus Woesearchaeota archaeon]